MSQLFNYLTSHSARSSIFRMFSPWCQGLVDNVTSYFVNVNYNLLNFEFKMVNVLLIILTANALGS